MKRVNQDICYGHASIIPVIQRIDPSVLVLKVKLWVVKLIIVWDIFTLLVMLATTDPRIIANNIRIAKRLILPLAVLSVTFVWYCKIMVGLVKYLLALQTSMEISNPRRGNKSRFPVPTVFLLWSSMFPSNNFKFSNGYYSLIQPFPSNRICPF